MVITWFNYYVCWICTNQSIQRLTTFSTKRKALVIQFGALTFSLKSREDKSHPDLKVLGVELASMESLCYRFSSKLKLENLSYCRCLDFNTFSICSPKMEVTKVSKNFAQHASQKKIMSLCQRYFCLFSGQFKELTAFFNTYR